MSMMWVGIGSAVLGAGTSLYGASQQKKANQSALDQNAALQEEPNRSAWASYLMSRGVNPAGAKTGEIPTNPQAINAKLPLWASVRRSPQVTQGFRVGVRANAGPRLSMDSQNFQNTGSNVSQSQAAATTSAGKESSNLNDVLIGNPLGIGGKNRTWYDPLGIF